VIEFVKIQSPWRETLDNLNKVTNEEDASNVNFIGGGYKWMGESLIIGSSIGLANTN
jgi:hypothetical protein